MTHINRYINEIFLGFILQRGVVELVLVDSTQEILHGSSFVLVPPLDVIHDSSLRHFLSDLVPAQRKRDFPPSTQPNRVIIIKRSRLYAVETAKIHTQEVGEGF